MPPTRRRGHDLEQAILAAVREELAVTGYSGLTFEGVAARARTSKPVLYRRWSSRSELVAAAIFERFLPDDEQPDTGDLRGDVVATLKWARQRFHSLGAEVLWGLMAESIHDPVLTKQMRDRLFHTLRHGAMSTIVDRAAARGEIDLTKLPNRVISLPAELGRQELLSYGELSDDAIASIVDDVFLPLVRLANEGHRR